MGLLLILPLLVSGFIVCLKDRVVFSRLHRYDGQLLYLLVAYHGLICFLAAFALTSLVSMLISHQWSGGCAPFVSNSCLCIESFNTDFLAWGGDKFNQIDTKLGVKGQVYFFFTLVGVLTCGMPFILAPLKYRWFKWKIRAESDEDAQVFLNVKAIEHLPITKTLSESLLNKRPLMLTMADKKVYVGIIQSIGSATEVSGALEHFGIWPLLSGYRDKDTLKVTFTHDYPPFDKGSIPVFFKQENIISATAYDEGHGDKIVERPEEKGFLAPLKDVTTPRALIFGAGLIAALLALKRR